MPEPVYLGPAPNQRTWRAPLPILERGGEIEGTDILREHAGDHGMVLWKVYRLLSNWAHCSPAERFNLFSPGMEEERLADILVLDLPSEMIDPLLGIVPIVASDRREVSWHEIGASCVKVGEAAEREDAKATGMLFRQMAALVCPGDPLLALEAGKAARELARYTVAESWLKRAAALARQQKEWKSYALAHIALGKQHIRRGALPEARISLERAARQSRRHSLAETGAMAWHDLFTLEIECGDRSAATSAAAAAFELYEAGDPSLPSLAHDVGVFWMEGGHFAPALSVFEATAEQVGRGGDVWLACQADIARAAGALGREDEFERAAAAVTAAPRDAHVRMAIYLLQVVKGAASLGRYREAERVALRAVAIAKRRGENKTRIEAEELLGMARQKAALEGRRRVAAKERRAADQLAHGLVAKLASPFAT
ncbi:MAG: hypothetical protein ACREKN_06490 [Longimicrobiaceae bacterium]